jgi:catechol-2,3-dioxygenase
MADTPALFRIILQVSDLDQAEEFYGKLLGDKGRRIPYASRHYIDSGPVIVALVDPSVDGEPATPLPDYIYFAVDNLDEIHARASALNCLAKENVHGAASGDIVVRPWGERSFYVNDPWGNGLCFVDKTTLFTGR